MEGKISEDTLRQVRDNLKNDGILYSEADHGPSCAGFISTGDRTRIMSIRKGDRELWVKVIYDLVVNRHHPQETKGATVLHELGHLYCGHLGTPDEKWWVSRMHLDINVEEFEAESVCWLICERMGIKNPSIETILKAVNIIETMIKGTKTPRKEIIVEINTIK